MYKLGFEEAEEPEINLPTFIGLWRKQGSKKKTKTDLYFSVYAKAFVGMTTEKYF